MVTGNQAASKSSDNSQTVESVAHGDGLTDQQAEEIRASLEEIDERIAAKRAEILALQTEMREATKDEQEEIAAAKARIAVLQVQAQAKVAGKEAEFKALNGTVSDLLSESAPKRQRINAYVVAKMAELQKQQNQYAALLPSTAKKLMPSMAITSEPNGVEGRRHNKGCKTGELRLAGGSCKLCVETGQW